MPKRQENNSEDSEHSQNSSENVGKQNPASRVEKRNKVVTPAQGETREFREHSRESLDLRVRGPESTSTYHIR